MDLDIIRKTKFLHLKASFGTLALKHKLTLILILISLLTTLMPHESYAAENEPRKPDLWPKLVFDLSDLSYIDYLNTRSQELSDQYYKDQMHQQAVRQIKLTDKVRAYLQSQHSPLSEYAATLITLRNWKKIVALANAESSMCEHYPVDSANCWGVGGTNLWDMGANLGEGIVAMNHFLNKYPLRSATKYSQMSFERMNGLYKQPAAEHWVGNTRSVFDDLVSLENNL